MNRDGSDAHAISAAPADEYHASFSPDGSRVVMVSEANGNRDVWVMPGTAGTPVPITDDPGVEDHPDWSPDGERLVYTALPREGGNFELWVINADGSGKHRLTSTAANELFPTWHPDGETIAYVTDAGGNFDIHGIRLSDQSTFPIVTGPDHDVRPQWSPDGTKIAFARWPARGSSEQSTLWMANADGTVPIELGVPPGATHPAWAPDGLRIAFQRRTDARWDIWTYALPADLARPGRLHLAQQLRSRSADLVVLRTGNRLTGSVRNRRYAIRTAYATLEFPRKHVAALRFPGAQGIVRVVLVNGDTVSGILLTDTIRVATPEGERIIGAEKLASVGLRVAADIAATGAGLRFTMRNGDVLTATVRGAVLRVRVAGQAVDIVASAIAYAHITGDGASARAELLSGETVSGKLMTMQLDLDLALGPTIRIRPGQIRSIVGMPPKTPAAPEEGTP